VATSAARSFGGAPVVGTRVAPGARRRGDVDACAGFALEPYSCASCACGCANNNAVRESTRYVSRDQRAPRLIHE
jgi:hypothetical protein